MPLSLLLLVLVLVVVIVYSVPVQCVAKMAAIAIVQNQNHASGVEPNRINVRDIMFGNGRNLANS
jgi:hypothetical protein